MTGNAIFNATVCIMGIAILMIHVVNLILKKNKRKDENRLLIFLVFTVVHFATYLTFTLIKMVYTSKAYFIGFYTTFYIFLYFINIAFFYHFITTPLSLKKHTCFFSLLYRQSISQKS